MSPNSPSTRRGWLVVAAAIGINLILGSLYAWGVIGKALRKGSSWSASDASLPFTVSTAAFAITMIFAGRAQDKAGPKIVATIGGIAFGLGLFLSGFVSTPIAMAMTFGVLGGIGLGFCYSATTPPCVKWFPPARKGLITGLVVGGVGIAAAYVAPVTYTLIQKWNIPTTFMVLGGSAIVLISIFSQFLQNPPAGYVAAPAPAATAQSKPAVPRHDADWAEMLGTGQFYTLWVIFTLSASAGLMMIMHVGLIAKEQASWDWGFMPIAVLAVFNTLGRVLAGFVSDRIGRTRTMVMAFVLQAVNMFFFSHYRDPNSLIFGSAATGICYGAIFTLMPAAIADFYGIRNLGVNYGLLFTAFGMAGVVGPLLTGKIRDAAGSYNPAYTTSGCLLVVAAVLALTVRAPKRETPAPEPVRQAVASK